MKRPWDIWVLFALCLAVALGASPPAVVHAADPLDVLAPLYGPGSKLPPEVQYTKLCCMLAPTVAVVEVLAPEAAKAYRMPGGLPARVVEVFGGRHAPKTVVLWGLMGEDLRRYPAGSRWLVAFDPTGSHMSARVLDILPDSAGHRRDFREWTMPGWKLSPAVLVARLARREKTNGMVKLFFVADEALRGERPRTEIVYWRRAYPNTPPLTPGRAKFVLAVDSVWPSKDGKVTTVALRSLERVTDQDVARIKKALQADPLGKLQKTLRAEHDAMQRFALAWRFFRAPLVAEVKVSSRAGEISGAGGVHLAYRPTRVLRGKVPATLPPPPRTTFPLLTGLGPGLVFGGGHGYYGYGKEKVGDRFIVGAVKAGAHAHVRLPHTKANVAFVKAILRRQAAPFACRPITDPARGAGPSKKKGKRGNDRRGDGVFQRSVSLRAALMHLRRPVRFQITALSLNRTGPASLDVVRARFLDPAARYVNHRRKEIVWQFEGPQLPVRGWRNHGQWWGAWLDDGVNPAPVGHMFVPGLFLPVRFPVDHYKLEFLARGLNRLRTRAPVDTTKRKAVQ